MKRQYVMVRVSDKTHARLAGEMARMAEHRDFLPLASRFKHSFSLGDVIDYLLEFKERHRERARQQQARKRKAGQELVAAVLPGGGIEMGGF